jgi:hypothetical protein
VVHYFIKRSPMCIKARTEKQEESFRIKKDEIKTDSKE